MSETPAATDQNDNTVTYTELLEQIDDEEAELDRERALYGNCDVDACTYPQVNGTGGSWTHDNECFRATSNGKPCSCA